MFLSDMVTAIAHVFIVRPPNTRFDFDSITRLPSLLLCFIDLELYSFSRP